MTQSATATKPFWLQDNFAPVFEERTETRLEVTGSIPPELNGRFFRNGSNPQTGESAHWFLGNGMIHGVELSGGRANWYRNRYVRTPLFETPDAPRIREDGTMDRSLSLANTHVVSHAGRILALEEGSYPFEVTKELETVGVCRFGGKLDVNYTAHPKICAETGEMLAFGYGATPPYLTYLRVSADGELLQQEEITVKGGTMMHDFNVTRNFVIFMDLPMVFDLAALAQGGLPIRWDDAYGARLGVMPRNGSDRDVVWYEIEPCYVFHPMNAYEDGERIVLDVSRFPKFDMAGGDTEPAVLHRWIIDRQAGKVIEQPLDDRAADFPRVADGRVGLKHRFGYMTSTGGGGGMAEFGRRLFKYDLASGETLTQDFGPGVQAGEPVPASVGAGEDEGYILTFVYDPNRHRSDLVILDAQRFDREPVARIHLPTRVPNGFHGSWIPDPA